MAKKVKKISRCVYIKNSIDDMLMEKAEREGRSVSNLMDNIITTYLRGITEEDLEGYDFNQED